MRERIELAIGRIAQIRDEKQVPAPFELYFSRVAGFIFDTYNMIESVDDQTGQEELAKINRALYADILPEHYAESFGNPDYAVSVLGEDYGQYLSFLYTQVRGIIPFLFEMKRDERRCEDVAILLEIFLEVYSSFMSEENGAVPGAETIRDILYWFVSDYADITMTERVNDQLLPENDFALRLVMDSDLTDLSYLYRFGEYITENELGTARHLNAMSEDQIQAMADTYTEGYRMGFVTTGKDLSKKSVVDVRYVLGFERVVRAAVKNFEKMGLKCVIYRKAVHAVTGSLISRIGYYGACPNRQYEYDHKEDQALFLDKAFKDRKLDLLRQAYEERKSEAAGYAGPAVMEVFGEVPFAPEKCDSALKLSDKQQKLSVEYASKSGRIVNEYIKGEERSFTIIAYPVPEIGENYNEIFDETVKLNTLDYETYKRVQQVIIDELDKSVSVKIKGCGGNCTDLTVKLRRIENPERETQFENCVADVNIPVGEVFTSPVLEGTDGVLFVSRVYLDGLEYRDMRVEFKDGVVTKTSCSNFEDPAAGEKYIKENVLKNHETLPLGEFAIGTNTTAYAMAKRFDIFDRLPILIAEKTGPHFAVGDTCYSHAEDVPVFNPDGKEIIARDNSFSILRKTEPDKAYFNCHTDITIPYEEIGSITAIGSDGSETLIIENGRFVLAGTELLNEPLE